MRAQPDRPLIVGTSTKGEKDISQIDLTVPAALVIGNETFGLSEAWKEMCDVLVKIPICGAAASLNAGGAATVCFYEISRQRREREWKSERRVVAGSARACKKAGAAGEKPARELLGKTRRMEEVALVAGRNRLPERVGVLPNGDRMRADRTAGMPKGGFVRRGRIC